MTFVAAALADGVGDVATNSVVWPWWPCVGRVGSWQQEEVGDATLAHPVRRDAGPPAPGGGVVRDAGRGIDAFRTVLEDPYHYLGDPKSDDFGSASLSWKPDDPRLEGREAPGITTR